MHRNRATHLSNDHTPEPCRLGAGYFSPKTRNIVIDYETHSHRVSRRLLMFSFIFILGCGRELYPLPWRFVFLSWIPTSICTPQLQYWVSIPFFHLCLCVLWDCSYTRFHLFCLTHADRSLHLDRLQPHHHWPIQPQKSWSALSQALP